MTNWKLDRDAEGIAWATLDCAGASTNTLSQAVMAELAALLDELERQPPKGLVFRSGKEAGFIAGADIEEFTRLDTAEKATRTGATRLGPVQSAGGGEVSDAGPDPRPLHGRRPGTGTGVPLPRRGR